MAETKPGTTRGLVAACLAASLMPLNSTMIAVAVPAIAKTVGHDPGTVTQALVATYLVAGIALQSPGGKLGDRIGQWRAFALGQALLALGALGGFLASSLWLLTASRVVMASGGAVVVPATIALLRNELPENKRGRAFGIFGSVMSLSAGIGPLIGGELVRLFGWQSVFLVNLPIVGLSALLALTVHHEPTPRRPARFDWAGSVLLAGALTCLVGAVEVHGDAVLALVAAGVVIAVLFAAAERRAADPVVAFRLFGAVRFSAGTLVVALHNLVMYALLFEIPLVFAAVFGADAEATGRVLVFMMLAMAITSTIAGRLVDHLGPRILGLAGVALCLTGVILLRTIPLHAMGDVRLALVLLGVGIGLATPAAQTASMSDIAHADAGMAAGISSTMRYLGGIVGVSVLGRMLDASGSASEVLADHRRLLVAFAAVLIATLGCAALLGTKPAREPIPAPATPP